MRFNINTAIYLLFLVCLLIMFTNTRMEFTNPSSSFTIIYANGYSNLTPSQLDILHTFQKYVEALTSGGSAPSDISKYLKLRISITDNSGTGTFNLTGDKANDTSQSIEMMKEYGTVTPISMTITYNL